MLYLDTSYLVRLYTKDAGWEKVRALAKTDSLACCIHGQAETVAAFHRKVSEGGLTQKDLGTLLAEFDKDSHAGAYRWLPLSPAVVTRLLGSATDFGLTGETLISRESLSKTKHPNRMPSFAASEHAGFSL